MTSKKKHPDFDTVQGKIAKEYKKKDIGKKKAENIGGAITANVARNASPTAKKANSNLKKVKSK